MSSLPDDFAPYAPVSNILNLIHRLRDRGLPNPLTLTDLEKLGISESTTSRVSQTLRFLDLIDDETNHTDGMEALRKASTEQYQATLKGIIENSYKSVFTYVNPAIDDEAKITDQFRHFKPTSIRPRMVSLFMGLCQEAGIVTGNSAPRATPLRKTSLAKSGSTPARKHTHENGKPPASATDSFDSENESGQKQNDATGHPGASTKYQLLQVLLSQLPSDAVWTEKRRNQWLGALTANIDLIIEVEETEDQKEPQ